MKSDMHSHTHICICTTSIGSLDLKRSPSNSMVYICSKGALDSYYLRSCRCFWPRFPSPPVKYLNVALHGSQKSIDIRINFAYDPTLQAIRSPRKRQFGVDWFWCFEELTLSLVHNIYYLTNLCGVVCFSLWLDQLFPIIR